MITPVSSEYLAGLFDGEGTIRIQKTSPNIIWEIVTPRYVPRIALTNTHLKTLKEIQETHGGRISETGGTNKPCYQLCWSSTQVEPVLRKMWEHLRIKKEHARLLLQFIYYTKAIKAPGRKPRRDSDVALRERFYRLMRTMNSGLRPGFRLA